ncbi:Cyclic nucleotide-binding domain-containing protein [Candidatus Kryptonium thompsonii]|jgi:CRP-like cAMP-binding protein|uniref:Cyclic nucleotide-binding domain-containing protein n=1 Tax=Candidatus Kryptonium thompsonii TaxID=1633631 RepID=A0A0P1MNA0_9BACT|nr:cyclic nucleotide-binding domain-containing protein [Candidatus Kryptonium thompsoni]CUS82107.1 Cyclic nucleotide-binding domain-containing protein [Candidatus Kryptonium thompsoni]CUS86568.1 Cyclic nucleotide-binding domain-containing protein [Candidatus Kryptonium thompsoni]CUS89140.1 Cyclic nucleotide-binding domain-containing protein [Candidatus Kryptonium thompsoni]CUS90509.1 Cyclic nucleotide-binding domain-containing protein [Candidatus Kryptonium thompsoni]CUS91018.1 Cyclic nucleoti
MIPRDIFWANIFRGRKKKDETVEAILKDVPAFSHLEPKEISLLASIVHKREYKAGEYIFYQGDPGLGMYIIQEGEVLIQYTDPDGNKKELAILKDGDFFGEIALIDESPRSASAICRTDCQIIGFFRPDLFEIIEKHPRLGIKIVLKLAEIIAERLRRTNQEVTQLKAEIEALKSNIEELKANQG